MEELETIWRFLVAGVAVWRLSQLLFGESESKSSERDSEDVQGYTGVRFWASRALDLLCWISVSLSSQTALWVAYGFAGVLFSWVSVSGVSRFSGYARGQAELLSKTTARAEVACVSCADGMQAHHG